MGDVTVYVVRAVSMFAPGSQSARLAGSESKMVRVITEADHDRIVAEAWADGARTALQWDWGHYVACAVLDGGTCDCEIKGEIEESVAALRKPEVEG